MIYVDGEETEIQPVGEAMTGCWMTAGEHQITSAVHTTGICGRSRDQCYFTTDTCVGNCWKSQVFSADIIGKCNKFLTNFYKKIKSDLTNREFVIYHFEENQYRDFCRFYRNNS